ncbi:MAG TPA: HNH endonuclease [Gemmatimonadaceae bacterium]|nr:HNH endonuclease [Gemmatimonadaceae bacterium]
MTELVSGLRLKESKKSMIRMHNKMAVRTVDDCDRKVDPGKKSEKGVTPPGNERQADHIIPKSKGGDGSPSNGRTLCRDCNIKKSDKDPQ